jgi:hypothetical protein
VPLGDKEIRTMSTAVIHTLDVAEEYLAAWKRKDIEGIAKLVHPEIHLKSPVADVTGRESFLITCQKIFPILTDVRIHAKFASETRAMMTYDFALHEPLGVTRTANLMTFERRLIRSVELFFDARPFEKPGEQARSAT